MAYTVSDNSVSSNSVSRNSISDNSVSGNSPNANFVTLKNGRDYTVTYENNINAFETDTDAGAVGNAGNFAVIPIMVSFSNYKDAVLHVKIIFDNVAMTVADPAASPASGRQPEQDGYAPLYRS